MRWSPESELMWHLSIWESESLTRVWLDKTKYLRHRLSDEVCLYWAWERPLESLKKNLRERFWDTDRYCDSLSSWRSQKCPAWWLTTYPESLNTDEPFSHIIKNPSKTRELVITHGKGRGRWRTWRRPWAPRWSAPPSWRQAPAPPPHLTIITCQMTWEALYRQTLPSG